MNSPTRSNRQWMAAWATSLASACLLTGCLSRPALEHQSFALESPTPAKPANAKTQGVLAVRPVEVSPLFEGRALVYRVGPDLYQADPYAGFMVTPSRALGIPIRAGLSACGLFQSVLEPGSQLPADTVLEAHATELYGDFRKAGAPAAVLSLKLLWFDQTAQGPKLLLQKDYTQTVPLKEQSATALVAGWNQALTQIMSQAVGDLAASR